MCVVCVGVFVVGVCSGVCVYVSGFFVFVCVVVVCVLCVWCVCVCGVYVCVRARARAPAYISMFRADCFSTL